MGRPKRTWVSQEVGSYHIISRVAGGEFLFNDKDKEFFLELLERFSQCFFVQIHAFAVMSNHFHILATGLDKDACLATKEELLRRYSLLYKNEEPPTGTYDSSGQFIPDEDGGVERLRFRLGSVSRFVQELKQTFSRWYNKKYNRTGYLWGNRFKGVIVDKGEAQLTCSIYIDLNPVRANIVSKVEDYRWSSLGLRVRSPKRANKLLHPLSILPTGEYEENMAKEWFAPLVLKNNSIDHFSIYREFVYRAGGIERKGYAHIWPELVDEVVAYHGKLGLGERFRFRLKNFSEGLAIGGYSLIAKLQRQWNRKHIRPRSFMGRDKNCGWSYSTRVLRL